MTSLRRAALPLLGGALLLGLQAASAATMVETCLPPACAAPMALSWPDGFGASASDKLGMAVGLLCAWLMVWGAFLLVGHKPSRRAPLPLLFDKAARDFWRARRQEEDKEWREMRADPAARRRARNLGAVMVVASAVLMKMLIWSDPTSSNDLGGSIATVQRWNGREFAVDAVLKLSKGGGACAVKGDYCAPWGKWISRTDFLILIPESSRYGNEPYVRLLPDESNSRYWAKPESGSLLVSMVSIERPKAEKPPVDPFDAKSSMNLD